MTDALLTAINNNDKSSLIKIIASNPNVIKIDPHIITAIENKSTLLPILVGQLSNDELIEAFWSIDTSATSFYNLALLRIINNGPKELQEEIKSAPETYIKIGIDTGNVRVINYLLPSLESSYILNNMLSYSIENKNNTALIAIIDYLYTKNMNINKIFAWNQSAEDYPEYLERMRNIATLLSHSKYEKEFESFLAKLDPKVKLLLDRINEWGNLNELAFNLHIKFPCETKNCTDEINAVIAEISLDADKYKNNIIQQNELKRDVLFNVVNSSSATNNIEVANTTDLIGNDLVELPDDVIFGVIEGNQVFRFSYLDFDGLKSNYTNPYTTRPLSNAAKAAIGKIESDLKALNINNVLTLTETIESLTNVNKLPPKLTAAIEFEEKRFIGIAPVDERLHNLVTQGYWSLQDLRNIPDNKSNNRDLINFLREYNINVNESKNRNDILQQLIIIANKNETAKSAIDQAISDFISDYKKASESANRNFNQELTEDELLALQLQEQNIPLTEEELLALQYGY